MNISKWKRRKENKGEKKEKEEEKKEEKEEKEEENKGEKKEKEEENKEIENRNRKEEERIFQIERSSKMKNVDGFWSPIEQEASLLFQNDRIK